MRFIVYGAGAVGGVVGARLALAGSDVQLVARGAHLEAIRSRGLRLVTPEGSSTVQIPAAATVADLDVSADTAVLLTVKGHQTPAAVDDLSANRPESTTMVSVQNGVANERTLLRSFDHVLGVTVMLPASHLEPGVVIQNSSPVPGMLDVGRYPTGTDGACEEFASAVRAAGFDSVVRPDVMAW
ncbi:MAG: ketopantoate reductase family protein, partial [Marmoricola sp.]